MAHVRAKKRRNKAVLEMRGFLSARAAAARSPADSPLRAKLSIGRLPTQAPLETVTRASIRDLALMAAKRFDATKIHTHTFDLEDLPEALRYARERVDDAIKVVVRVKSRLMGQPAVE